MEERLVKDQNTSHRMLKYPNRMFTDALGTLIEQSRYILYEHIWSTIGESWGIAQKHNRHVCIIGRAPSSVMSFYNKTFCALLLI